MPLNKSGRFEVPSGSGPTIGEMLKEPEKYAAELDDLRKALAESKSFAARCVQDLVSVASVQRFAEFGQMTQKALEAAQRQLGAGSSIEKRLAESAVYIPPAAPAAATQRELRRLSKQVERLNTAMTANQEQATVDDHFRALHEEALAKNDNLREENAALKAEIYAMKLSDALKLGVVEYPALGEDDFEKN